MVVSPGVHGSEAGITRLNLDCARGRTPGAAGGPDLHSLQRGLQLPAHQGLLLFTGPVQP